jgi:hypothetical protein
MAHQRLLCVVFPMPNRCDAAPEARQGKRATLPPHRSTPWSPDASADSVNAPHIVSLPKCATEPLQARLTAGSGLPLHGFHTERASQFERSSLRLGEPLRGDARPRHPSPSCRTRAGQERALWHGFCSLEDCVLGRGLAHQEETTPWGSPPGILCRVCERSPGRARTTAVHGRGQAS